MKRLRTYRRCKNKKRNYLLPKLRNKTLYVRTFNFHLMEWKYYNINLFKLLKDCFDGPMKDHQ